MEMKEFYYHDGIRISLFNLDHGAVAFHQHKEVSDMIYCAKGSINIELPEQQKIFHVAQGEVFQIPSGTKHRFVNGQQVGEDSRYILMQLGKFDIEFVQDVPAMRKMLDGVCSQKVSQAPVYIEERKQDILALAQSFNENKPKQLTEEELQDVVHALRFFAHQGIASRFSKSLFKISLRSCFQIV